MNYGPCMCGDICCPSCGPAQGNHRCLVCREWASEGCKDPEACAKALPAAIESERAMDEAMWRDIEQAEKEAAEYYATRDLE